MLSCATPVLVSVANYSKNCKQSADAKKCKQSFIYFFSVSWFISREGRRPIYTSQFGAETTFINEGEKKNKSKFFYHILLMKLHKKYAVHSSFRNYVHSSFHKRKKDTKSWLKVHFIQF